MSGYSNTDGLYIPMPAMNNAQQLYEQARSMGVNNYNITDAVRDDHAGVRSGGSAPAPRPASRPRPRPAAPRRPVSRPSSSRGRSSGGRRSGGGGGGGGASATLRANTMLQTQAMLDLLNSSLYKFSPNDALRGRVNTAVDTDVASANAANDTLVQRLAQIQATNPYASLRAQSTQAKPVLNGLLESQGANGQGYMQQLAALNAQGDQMANNWNNLYQAQGANYGQGVQSQNAQAAYARTQNQQEIAAQRNALLALVDQQDEVKRTQTDQAKAQIAQQLISMIGAANAQLPSNQLLNMPTLQQLGLA